MAVETSNLVYRLTVASPSLMTTSHPWKGCGRGPLTHFRILDPLKYLCNGYSWRLQILYTSWPREVLAFWWLTVPQVGLVRVIWPISTFWAQAIFFGADEARHFKFGLQIELNEHWHYTIHVLKFCSMGVHLGSRDLLKFWEISTNISEVLDRHIVIMEDK